MTRFRLGINTCFAVKRWPDPMGWAEIVRDDLGLDLVQHSLDLVDVVCDAGARTDQAIDVAAACQGYELELHSTFTGLAAYSSNLLLHPDERARRRATDWYRAAIDFSADCGAPSTGGHLGAFSVADAGDPLRRALLTADLHRRLDELTRHAHDRGLGSLLVENMAVAREPATMAAIDDLVRPGDAAHVPITLCLDVGHQCVPGTTGADRDPYAWLRRFGGRAGLVQLQQSDAAADHHWAFTPEHNAAGRIDAGRVLDALASSGAEDVALILEVIPPFEQDDGEVLTDLIASVGYWRDAIAAGHQVLVLDERSR